MRTQLLTLLALPCFACVTVSSVERRPLTAGSAQTYAVQRDSLAIALKRSFAKHHLRLVRDTIVDGARMMLAVRRVPAPWGEINRVVLTGAPTDNRAEARILVQPREFQDIPAASPPTLFSRLDRQLEGRGLGPFPLSTVRVTLLEPQPRRLSGTLFDRDSAGTMVIEAGPERLTVLRAQMSRIEVSRGQVGHPRGGILVGLILGGVVGWFAAPEPQGEDVWTKPFVTLVGAVIGGRVGQGFGSNIRTHVWSEVKDR